MSLELLRVVWTLGAVVARGLEAGTVTAAEVRAAAERWGGSPGELAELTRQLAEGVTSPA